MIVLLIPGEGILAMDHAREVQMTPTCFTRTSFLEHQGSECSGSEMIPAKSTKSSMVQSRFATIIIAKRLKTVSRLAKDGEGSLVQMLGVIKQQRRLEAACIGERWETMVEKVHWCRCLALSNSKGDW